jgi:hypothetical protein
MTVPSASENMIPVESLAPIVIPLRCVLTYSAGVNSAHLHKFRYTFFGVHATTTPDSPLRRGPIAACAGYIGMPAENLREILEKLSCRRSEKGHSDGND